MRPALLKRSAACISKRSAYSANALSLQFLLRSEGIASEGVWGSLRGNCDERAAAQEVHFIQSLLPRASAVAGVAQDVRRLAVPQTRLTRPSGHFTKRRTSR